MIPIIQKRKIPFTLSAIVFLVSVVVLFVYGLKPGIDFTGGSLLEVTFSNERPANATVQEALAPLDLGHIQIQSTDEKGMILRMTFLSEEQHQQVLSTLRDSFAADTATTEEGSEDQPQIEVVPTEGSGEIGFTLGTSSTDEDDAPAVIEERFETIGPTVSAQLKQRSISTAIAVVVAIIVYVGYAFRRVSKPVQSWKYGVTAIIALIHDVTIAMAIFALLGHFRGIEIDIPFVVALLTIMGYSVNDTIVVFDRIRENLIKRGSGDFAETVNMGVNQTITRSINTSLTTLLVLSALFFFGGDSIHYFSLTLIIGVIVGTYSSIFLASPLLVVWQQLKNRRS